MLWQTFGKQHWSGLSPAESTPVMGWFQEVSYIMQRRFQYHSMSCGNRSATCPKPQRVACSQRLRYSLAWHFWKFRVSLRDRSATKMQVPKLHGTITHPLCTSVCHTISPCWSHLLSYLVAGVHGAASAQVILTQQLFLTNQPCCNEQLGWTVFTSCKLYQGQDVSFISIFLHPYNTWKIFNIFKPPWDVSNFLPRLVCPVIVSGCFFGFQRSSLHMVGCLAKKWSQVMGPDQKLVPWLSHG